MNIYEYNSSTINEYSHEGFGLINDSYWEMDDLGNLSDEIDLKEDFYQIDCFNTILPFGSIKIKNEKTKYTKTNNEIVRFIDLNHKSIVLNGIILRWIGFSIIFQLCNDLERKVIPDVSGGGDK